MVAACKYVNKFQIEYSRYLLSENNFLYNVFRIVIKIDMRDVAIEK